MTSVTTDLLRLSTSAPTEPEAHLGLEEMLDHAAHLLPKQSPLHMFVHHNTLHAFEHLHFEKAVVDAAARLGTQPYQSERAFAQCLESARIRASDIDAVLDRAGDNFDHCANELATITGHPAVQKVNRFLR